MVSLLDAKSVQYPTTSHGKAYVQNLQFLSFPPLQSLFPSFSPIPFLILLSKPFLFLSPISFHVLLSNPYSCPLLKSLFPSFSKIPFLSFSNPFFSILLFSSYFSIFLQSFLLPPYFQSLFGPTLQSLFPFLSHLLIPVILVDTYI
jgi:hypothetical protein